MGEVVQLRRRPATPAVRVYAAVIAFLLTLALLVGVRR